MSHEKTISWPRLRPWIAAALLCLALFVPAAAQKSLSQSLEISTRSGLGLLYGSGHEFVYNQAVSPNYKNSELFWPFEPLFYSGAGLSLASKWGLFANLDLRQGFAGTTGTMTDSDFLNGNGVKTHFSQSDGYTERALLLDLELGYDFPLDAALSRVLTLGVFGGFSYIDFKWSARDGYYQYPAYENDYSFDSSGNLVLGSSAPWSAGETKTPLYGTGILYEQAHAIGSLGIKASYLLLETLSLGASFAISPLAYCYAEDNHEARSINFYSKLSGGLMVEPRLSLTYALFPAAALVLSLDYRSVTNLIGDIIQVNQGTTFTSSGGNYYAGPDSASVGKKDSGAALSMLDASLMFRLAF